MNNGRVSVLDKQIFNGTSDVNQLVPFKHKWAWDKYLKGTESHWMPAEVDITRDIEYIGDSLDNAAINRILEQILAEASEPAMVQNPPELGIYRMTTSPECRQFLLRALFENTVHYNAFSHYAQALQTAFPRTVARLTAYPITIQKYQSSEFYESILCVQDTPTATTRDIVNIIHAIIDYTINERVLKHYRLMQLIFQPAVKTNMPGLYQMAERIVAANMRAAEFFLSMVQVAINEAGITPEEHELHLYIDALVLKGDTPPPYLHLLDWVRTQLSLGVVFRRYGESDNQLFRDAYYGAEATDSKAATNAVEESSGGLSWD